MESTGNVLWLCSICDKTQISENEEEYKSDSRVVRFDISQSGKNMKFDDIDTYEFKDVCLACRIKLSNSIYSTIEEINPEIYNLD